MHFFCNLVVAEHATRAEKSASVTDSSHSLLFGLLFIFVTNEAINLITDNLLQPFVSLRSFIIRHASLDSQIVSIGEPGLPQTLNHACNLPDNKFYITLLINQLNIHCTFLFHISKQIKSPGQRDIIPRRIIRFRKRGRGLINTDKLPHLLI